MLRFSLGVLPVIACLGWANWKMFGSPLSISYSRWQHFERGVATVSSQTHAFTASLIHGLPAILFDTKQGLFYCAPLFIVALAFGMRPFWRRSNNETTMFGLVCVSLIVFFSKYFFWAAGGGIRYLLPVIALGTIPLSFAVKAAFAADKKECQERK